MPRFAGPWLGMMLLGLTAGCGNISDGADTFDPSIATQVAPVVSRVDPTTGRADDIVTIFGVGYSVVANDNIIILGGTATPALGYATSTAANDEVEQLTFAIPSTAAAGLTSVLVSVYENSSNTNISLTILP